MEGVAEQTKRKPKTMRPKGKLFALLAIFAAIGLVTATGAFTTVSAERTATVDVAGDASALLGIGPAQSVDEGTVEENANGVLEIDLTGPGLGSGVAGLNPDANTTLTPLVNVTNNGDNQVDVTVTVASVETGNTDVDSSNIKIVDGSNSNITAQGQPLTAGGSFEFGLVIDLTGLDQSDFQGNDLAINIQIEATDSS